jgi:hypothetical protein
MCLHRKKTKNWGRKNFRMPTSDGIGDKTKALPVS